MIMVLINYGLLNYSVHRQRVADVAPHSDDNDEKSPDKLFSKH